MRILLVGGAAQGKRLRALELGGTEPDQVWDVGADSAPHWDRLIVDKLHLLVRSVPPDAILAELDGQSDWIVCCDEVGCGVVPIDAAERVWREAVGRLCCALAQQADVVERVVCGLPQRIKG